MKNFRLNNKEYKIPVELYDYIKELEYYYNYKIGTNVIEVHTGVIGEIVNIFPSYDKIPEEVLGEPHGDFLEGIGVPISEGHKKIHWILVLSENVHYVFPYVYWKIYGEEEDNISTSSNLDGANHISDE